MSKVLVFTTNEAATAKNTELLLRAGGNPNTEKFSVVVQENAQYYLPINERFIPILNEMELQELQTYLPKIPN